LNEGLNVPSYVPNSVKEKNPAQANGSEEDALKNMMQI
jgi:hypothetical protein